MSLLDGDPNSQGELIQAYSLRQRRHDLLDALVVIPPYSGNDSAYPLSVFKKKFTELSNFLQWPAEDALFALKQRLAGAALTTIADLKDEIKTSDDIFKFLRQRFGEKSNTAELHNDFWHFRQPENMPVAEFVALAKTKARKLMRKKEIASELQDKMIEADVFAMVLNNLRPTLKRGVIVANPKNVEELLKIAELEEKAAKQVLVQNSPLPPPSVDHTCAAVAQTSVITDLFSQMSDRMAAIEKKLEDCKIGDRVDRNMEPRAPRQVSRNIICHRCGLSGHVMAQCRVNLNNSQFRPQQANNSRSNWQPRPSFQGNNFNRGNQGQPRGFQNSYSFRNAAPRNFDVQHNYDSQYRQGPPQFPPRFHDQPPLN